jgi:hypothetical protein
MRNVLVQRAFPNHLSILVSSSTQPNGIFLGVFLNHLHFSIPKSALLRLATF